MKFRLLTTAIVSALNRQDATARGTVWNAEEVLDIQEGEALRIAGLAEQVDDEAEVTAYTYAQRAANPTIGTEVIENEDDEELRALLTGTVDEVVNALDGLDEVQLDRIEQLETEGKARKGVLDAIAQYKE